MSVITELNRITDAKDAIRQAIIAKGVNVPADATIDTYATYISQIATS